MEAVVFVFLAISRRLSRAALDVRGQPSGYLTTKVAGVTD